MRRPYLMSTAAALAAPVLWSTPAFAQDSAVANAGDAFGERVGMEQVGLYDEGQVRGFSLEGTGAYRIDDSYFVRAIFLPDPVLDGVSVRVGVNAARLEYPSPSGVVNYRLRDPGDASSLVMTAGVRPHMTGYLDMRANWVSEDGEFGLVAGFMARPDVTWDGGTNGQAYDMGAVGRWRPNDRLQVRAFVSYARRDYDGDYGVMPVDDALPPDAPKLKHLGPLWGEAKIDHWNMGVLSSARVGDWTLGVSAFRSMFLPERTDFTMLRTDADGDAMATMFQSGEESFVSDSVEARIARTFATGPLRHRLSASVRGRWSEASYGGSQAVDLGSIDIGRPIYGDPVPYVESGDRIEDRVEQFTGSLGYGLAIGDKLELRLGVHRSRYDKRNTPIGGPETGSSDDFWLYNVSAVWSVTDRLTLFGSWVTGLEETGTAPQNAVNRNEVLPPVEAEQRELGARFALTPRLSLIGAVFDVSKPTMGMRPDGIYGPVGDVRHRGVEASLTGQVIEGMTVVVGAVVLDPEVSGILVDTGAIGDEPAGLSKVVGIASVDWRLPWADKWTVDASVNYWGPRQGDSANSFEAPAVTTIGLGARYRFELGDTPGVLRVAVSNLTDESGWWASSSGLVWPIGPRAFRASVTFTFD